MPRPLTVRPVGGNSPNEVCHGPVCRALCRNAIVSLPGAPTWSTISMTWSVNALCSASARHQVGDGHRGAVDDDGIGVEPGEGRGRIRMHAGRHPPRVEQLLLDVHGASSEDLRRTGVGGDRHRPGSRCAAWLARPHRETVPFRRSGRNLWGSRSSLRH